MRSLRTRLLRDTVVAFMAASVFYLVALYAIFREGSELIVRDGLLGQAEDVAEALRFDADGRPRLALHDPMAWGYDAYFQNLKYRVLDADGRVVLASDGSTSALTRADGAPRLAEDYFQTGDALHVATFPVATAHGTFFVQTARSDRFFDLTAEAMLPVVVETAGTVGAITLALFGIVILLGVRRSLRPVQRASDEVAAISPQQLSARVSTAGIPSEILPMVDGINALLGRIEQAFSVQHRFLANAAHELKTPLSILRGELEIRLDPAARRTLLQEVDAMARTVNQLLQLAEASDLGGYRFGRVALAELAADAAALVGGLARARGVEVRIVVDAAADAVVEGDRAALQVALRNLLENAIQHSPVDGSVELRVQPGLLRVRDGGEGLDDETRAHLFERFWRRDRGGTGTGLGLSIVKEIMEAHGGTVHAGNRDDGRGASFALVFPAQRRRVERGVRSPGAGLQPSP